LFYLSANVLIASLYTICIGINRIGYYIKSESIKSALKKDDAK